MSDLSDPDGIEDDDLLAAEYVLGVLDFDARRRVERRARREDAMQRRIEDWEHRFAPMLAGDDLAEAPPASAWGAVEAQLDRMLRFAAPPRPAPVSERLVSRFWKWFGLGAFGLAAASIAALFVVAQPRVGSPPLAALIAPQGGTPIYAAVIDPRTARATLIPVAAGADAAHSNQLWLIGPDGDPRSLGLIPMEGPAQIVISPELVPDGGATLAVSQEPPGGSPTGKPTGPVVGTGELRRL